MASIEAISETAMQVITYAGMAKSSYMEGYTKAMSDGDENFSQAH